ncbi:MAG: LLM class flavin-dependent oxidoreductase, partial [Gammaproteobacteria bacterium]
ASTPNMIERWYGLDYRLPVTRVRETVTLLRAILAGEKTAFAGRSLHSHGFRLQAPPATPVPIHLGAIGGRMLELAGALADGVLLNDFTPPDRFDYACERIAAGARSAGRSLDDIELVKRRALYVTDDTAAGLAYFRQHLAFYASAAQYQNVLRELGYASAVEQAIAGYAARDRAQVTAAISDEMVRRIFTFGDEAWCREQVARDYAAGISSIVVSPQGGTAAAFARCAAAFARDAFTP